MSIGASRSEEAVRPLASKLKRPFRHLVVSEGDRQQLPGMGSTASFDATIWPRASRAPALRSEAKSSGEPCRIRPPLAGRLPIIG